METYLVDYFSLNCCGQSALTLAIENGHVDCVEYLLTLEHISIYQQDFDEFTAYDVATKNLQLALKDEFGTDDKIDRWLDILKLLKNAPKKVLN